MSGRSSGKKRQGGMPFPWKSTIYGLGVGLHSGYGGAQRLYAKRGYLPDGSGVWYRDAVCEPYTICRNDDDLTLYLSKAFDKETGR